MKKILLFQFLVFKFIVSIAQTKMQYPEGGVVIYSKDGPRNSEKCWQHGFVVSPMDLGVVNYDSAVKLCDELVLNGYDDWHLPNEKELKLLYENRYKIDNFSPYKIKNRFGNEELVNKRYWGTSISKRAPASYLSVYEGGQQNTTITKDTLYVRAVRYSCVSPPANYVPVKKNGGIVVYENEGIGLVIANLDFKKISYKNAVNSCNSLVLNGYSDWRMPSFEELQQIYKNRDKIGGFTPDDKSNPGGYFYWSYDSLYESSKVIHFKEGDVGNEPKNLFLGYARAVRTYKYSIPQKKEFQNNQKIQVQSGPKYCYPCQGSGLVSCKTCGGNGIIECKACYGQGYCSNCPGQRCNRCGITGRQKCDSGGCSNGKKYCFDCSGKGRVE
jgi:hypothetical protein